MNTDVKRRIVMSLVSLALAFGLLATYYIVTVPWNKTAVGQALTAGAVLGMAALVVQFVPIRKPVPAVAAPQPAAEPVPTRSWQPEPDFGPDDFAMDLAANPTSVEDPSVAATPIGLPPITTARPLPMLKPAGAGAAEPVVVHASPAEPIPIPVLAPPPSPPPPVRAPEPPTIPPEPAPSPPPQLVTSEPLVAALTAAEEKVPSDVLTVGEIKEGVEVLRVRNDHVHIGEPLVPAPAASPVPPPPSLAARTITARATGTPNPAPRKLPNLAAPASEWREPDPQAPRELLRELAEYWHVKYETEKKRHTEMASQYEDMLRRLERLEREAAPEKAPSRPNKKDSGATLTMDDLSVEDSASKENGADLEERWDQRATQIEHFH